MAIYEAETSRLWLQRMTIEEHLDDFHDLWKEPAALFWSTQEVKTTQQEAHDWMLTTLPSEENPNIDKFAILLKPVPENPEPYLNERGMPKMIGLVGTNRNSPQGLETGYCVNIKYWGKGYAGEAFKAFLELYWTLEERKGIKQLVAKVDPGNAASQRIVIRIGARKGEVLKDWYALAREGGKKRDIECWYIDRPGIDPDSQQKPERAE